MLRVYVFHFAGCYAEELGVKIVDLLNEPAPLGVHASLGAGVLVEEGLDEPAIVRDVTYGVYPISEQAPIGSRVRGARETTSQPDDCYRTHWIRPVCWCPSAGTARPFASSLFESAIAHLVNRVPIGQRESQGD